MGQDSLKKEVVKSGPDPLGGVKRTFCGPLWVCFGPFSAVWSIFAPFIPQGS